MRILYLGSPAFAVFPLEALVQAGHTVVAVVTQPDRPLGRSATPQPSPVKLAAHRLDLPLIQPPTLRDPAVVAELAALQPDVGVVAAYGEILRKAVLAIPPLGYVNIHPSLLPLYRGPTPVPGAILAGDSETGVTIMRLDQQMDSGPILAQATVSLAPTARTGPLLEELFHIGAQLLCKVLPLYAAGSIEPRPQDHSRATYTPMLKKEDGQIDWTLPALVIERQIRAFDPWPGTFTTWNGQPLKILAATVDAKSPGEVAPGTLLADPEPQVATGSGVLMLQQVQPAGKKPMAASAWLRGQRNALGQILGA